MLKIVTIHLVLALSRKKKDRSLVIELDDDDDDASSSAEDSMVEKSRRMPISRKHISFPQKDLPAKMILKLDPSFIACLSLWGAMKAALSQSCSVVTQKAKF